MSEKAGVVIPISRARKAKDRKFRGGGVMAEESLKVAKGEVLDMMKTLASAPKELAEVFAMPDSLFLVGDSPSLSSDTSKGIARVFGSLMTGQALPIDVPEYGIHISAHGSSLFCTLLDRKRKIIVCDSISGMQSENASWDSFIRSVRGALAAAKERQKSGEAFDFVVNKENSIRTIQL
jgi:hypothetical protein